jgi:hypothetical protein
VVVTVNMIGCSCSTICGSGESIIGGSCSGGMGNMIGGSGSRVPLLVAMVEVVAVNFNSGVWSQRMGSVIGGSDRDGRGSVISGSYAMLEKFLLLVQYIVSGGLESLVGRSVIGGSGDGNDLLIYVYSIHCSYGIAAYWIADIIDPAS